MMGSPPSGTWMAPKVRPSVEGIIREPFVFPEDILEAVRSDGDAWRNYCAFAEPYKRIRVAYIDAARKRPVGMLVHVQLDVRQVVRDDAEERHGERDEADGREREKPAGPMCQTSGDQEGRERVARDREKMGQTEQLEPAAEPFMFVWCLHLGGKS